MNTFADFMRHMAEEQEPQHLEPVQVVTRLREVFALRREVYEFEPGDILQHKWPGMASVSTADVPNLFIEYLDEPIRVWEKSDGENIGSARAADILDCRVGVILRGKFMDFLMDSREFRPHPDFAERELVQ